MNSGKTKTSQDERSVSTLQETHKEAPRMAAIMKIHKRIKLMSKTDTEKRKESNLITIETHQTVKTNPKRTKQYTNQKTIMKMARENSSKE